MGSASTGVQGGPPALHPRLARFEGSFIGEVLARFIQLRLLDQTYQISAAAFVALVPFVLILSTLFTGGQSAVAEQLVRRFGLAGSAAEAVRELLARPTVGVYWLAVVIVAWSAISVGRKMSTTYTRLWDVPNLPLRQQWRAIVWLAIQMLLVVSVSELRGLWFDHGPEVRLGLLIATVALWWSAELAAQFILTGGQVPVRSIALAAAFVTIGRIGLGLWAAFYLAESLAGQASTYGPIGVVFGVFTYIVATVGVLLFATLLASTWRASHSAAATSD